MPNAIILHGGPSVQEYYDPVKPSMSNAHWLPWLQAQLLKHDIPAATPEVPGCYNRDWAGWTREVERYDILPDTILIGHSTGAGYWIKYLSIHPDLTAAKTILVAPWIDPDQELPPGFFDNFQIDPNLGSRTQITIFNSDDDQLSVQKTVNLLRATISDIRYREFHQYGHFCYKNLGTDQFPELLAETLK